MTFFVMVVEKSIRNLSMIRQSVSFVEQNCSREPDFVSAAVNPFMVGRTRIKIIQRARHRKMRAIDFDTVHVQWKTLMHRAHHSKNAQAFLNDAAK